MYMQEALETVCRKRRLQPKEYALLLSDMSILIPLDRTVASLQGESDLRLVKRSMLPHMNVDVRPIGRSTDPNGTSLLPFSPLLPLLPSCKFALDTLTHRNDHRLWSFFFTLASIFKRMSDVPDLDYNISQDFTAAYKVSQPAARFKRPRTLDVVSHFFCPVLLTHTYTPVRFRNIPFTERCR